MGKVLKKYGRKDMAWPFRWPEGFEVIVGRTKPNVKAGVDYYEIVPLVYAHEHGKVLRWHNPGGWGNADPFNPYKVRQDGQVMHVEWTFGDTRGRAPATYIPPAVRSPSPPSPPPEPEPVPVRTSRSTDSEESGSNAGSVETE